MSRPLTFGVELEFCVAAVHPRCNDPHPDHPGRARYPQADPNSPTSVSDARAIIHAAIHAALRSAGLPLDRLPNFDFKHWCVTDDLSVAPPLTRARCNHSAYIWHSAEVISPTLYFCRESLDQLRVACAVISSHFRVTTTATSGLHVHVGDGVRGFSYGTIRRLGALLWAFEPQLLTLHPPHRHNDTWCRPFRTDSLYALDHPEARFKVVFEDLFNNKSRDIPWLVRQLAVGGGDCCAVDFSNLTDPVGEKLTIEFRLHSGTLDGDEVIMWVKTVVGLVEWAQCAGREQFARIMTYAEIGNEELGVVSLFEMLGLHEQARFYEGRLHPLGMDDEDSARVYDLQDFAEPRTDVLEEFGIDEDGKATRNNWEEDVVFDAFA